MVITLPLIVASKAMLSPLASVFLRVMSASTFSFDNAVLLIFLMASSKVSVMSDDEETSVASLAGLKVTVGAVVSMAVFVFVKIVPEPEPSNPNL